MKWLEAACFSKQIPTTAPFLLPNSILVYGFLLLFKVKPNWDEGWAVVVISDNTSMPPLYFWWISDAVKMATIGQEAYSLKHHFPPGVITWVIFLGGGGKATTLQITGHAEKQDLVLISTASFLYFKNNCTQSGPFFTTKKEDKRGYTFVYVNA